MDCLQLSRRMLLEKDIFFGLLTTDRSATKAHGLRRDSMDFLALRRPTDSFPLCMDSIDAPRGTGPCGFSLLRHREKRDFAHRLRSLEQSHKTL